MNTKFRQAIEMPKLAEALNVQSLNELNLKQKKAVQNIRGCADDRWEYVNAYSDTGEDEYRDLLLDAKTLFESVYKDSLEDVFTDGSCSTGKAAKSYLKDIRFCGKEFLQTVALYYTAKLLEEAFEDIDGTEEDARNITEALKEIKESI